VSSSEKFSVATLSTLRGSREKGSSCAGVDVFRGRWFAFRTEKKRKNGEKRRRGEKEEEEEEKGDSRPSLS